MAQKPETRFRQTKVLPFLKRLKNTAFFPIQQKAIRGDADLFLCCRGRFVALELKSMGGEPSPLQLAKLAWITQAQGIAIVAHPANWAVVQQALSALDGGTYRESVDQIKMKYSEASSFPLAQAIQKLAATPTDGKSACRIRAITRHIGDARKKMADEYQKEVVEKFAKRDDKGEIVRPEGHPNGFEPQEEKQEEFIKAQEEFGKKEHTLECIPLTLNEIKDVKLSAQELEALGGLFTEVAPGPGLPENVTSLR